MLHPTQAQIMQPWKDKSHCVVSIICTTFNQEAYIQQAINSFLMQQTDFPFEIVIHDDASTDKTPSLIKEYHLQFPDIIKPIFQKENQYSKGRFKPSVFAASHSCGEYIALCEGDDYWVDKLKIQKQFEALVRYSDCDICFNPAHFIHRTTIKLNDIINKYGSTERVFSLNDLIKGGGGFCPTASLMFRRHIFETLPPWFAEAPIGDYYLQVLGAKKNGALYLPDVMSAYRWASTGSLSTLTGSSSLSDINKFILKDMASLDELAIDLGPKYTSSIKWRKAAVYTGFSFIALGHGDFCGFKDLIEHSWYIQKNISKLQTLVFTMRKLPFLLRVLLKIKRFLFFGSRSFGRGWS